MSAAKALGCRWCGRPVKRADGAIEFVTVHADGREDWPWGAPMHHGSFVTGFVAHLECGPDTGYWIGLDRIDDVHLGEHLANKSGWSHECAAAYHEAKMVYGGRT